MKNKGIVLIILMVLLSISSVYAADKNCETHGSFTVCILSDKYRFFHPLLAIIQPSTDVKPGQTVSFDSRIYMDCGICDLTRYPVGTINGYVIKVFNPNGNLVNAGGEWFNNDPTKPWALKCGQFGNVYYSYDVPSDAVSGSWKIKLEVATHSIVPWNPDCIVGYDEGTFTVGQECVDKNIEKKYCYNEQTLYYKPIGTCQVTYTNCPDVCGEGCKCLDAKCQKVEKCGDNICDELENPYNCYVDCGKCGDKLCTGPETPQSCPTDCYSCGDGTCQTGEDLSCPKDCHTQNCGDSLCLWYEKPDGEYPCPKDCVPCTGDNCNPTDCVTTCEQKYKCSITQGLGAIPCEITKFFGLPICKLVCSWNEWVKSHMQNIIVGAILGFIVALFIILKTGQVLWSILAFGFLFVLAFWSIWVAGIMLVIIIILLVMGMVG